MMRWLRFRLRTLLLIMLALGVLAASFEGRIRERRLFQVAEVRVVEDPDAIFC